MSYAIMKPTKPDIGLAIPPLKLSDIPFALQKTWTKDQLAKAQQDFENSANNDYYSEWFWFTYQKQAWVNTWNTTTDSANVTNYPSPFETWIQWVENWLGGVITGTKFFQALPGR